MSGQLRVTQMHRVLLLLWGWVTRARPPGTAAGTGEPPEGSVPLLYLNGESV